MRRNAVRKVSALKFKAFASASDIAGSTVSITPCRPTMLGRDKVTPCLLI
jgi:hypothetical protein